VSLSPDGQQQRVIPCSAGLWRVQREPPSPAGAPSQDMAGPPLKTGTTPMRRTQSGTARNVKQRCRERPRRKRHSGTKGRGGRGRSTSMLSSWPSGMPRMRTIAHPNRASRPQDGFVLDTNLLSVDMMHLRVNDPPHHLHNNSSSSNSHNQLPRDMNTLPPPLRLSSGGWPPITRRCQLSSTAMDKLRRRPLHHRPWHLSNILGSQRHTMTGTPWNDSDWRSKRSSD